jgi:hypothetical protein
VAIGVLVEVVEGMVRKSSNERIMKVMNCTLETHVCLSTRVGSEKTVDVESGIRF